jgi:predicted dehydrogenase
MGVVNQQGRPFTHGFEIHLERATLHFEFAGFTDSGETMPVKLIDNDDRVIRPTFGSGNPIDGFIAEIREVSRALESGKPSSILGGDLALDAIRICAAEAEAVKSKSPVRL